jgi:hypothetical protein
VFPRPPTIAAPDSLYLSKLSTRVLCLLNAVSTRHREAMSRWFREERAAMTRRQDP